MMIMPVEINNRYFAIFPVLFDDLLNMKIFFAEMCYPYRKFLLNYSRLLLVYGPILQFKSP